MRLQDTYSLKTSQLANGEISTNFKSKRLTGSYTSFNYYFTISSIARDCYDLGRVAYTNDDFYHTLMWMQEALDHLNDEIGKESVNEFDILDHLAFATSEVKIFQEIFSIHVDSYFVLGRKYRTCTCNHRKNDFHW